MTVFNICPQIVVAISVSLGAMIVGFVSVYSSPAISSMKTNPGNLGAISDSEAFWITSLLPLFGTFGSLAGGPAIDRLGRRFTILLTGSPFLISFLLIAFAVDINMILAARAIAGFFAGINLLALVVYLVETIETEVRGTLGLLLSFFANLGVLVCFVAGKYLNWSQLAVVGAVIPVPFSISVYFIPESPRWLMSKGKEASAIKALQWLRGSRADIHQEFSEMKRNHKASIEHLPGGIKELFSEGNQKPFLISLGLMLFQQLTGINAIMYYAVEIFEKSESSVDKNWCTVIIALVNLIATLVSSALIDRTGRKHLLYLSSLLMASTLSCLCLYFYFIKDKSFKEGDLGWIPLANLILYIIGFSIGFGPIPYLLMGEILPAKIRGTGASIVTSFNSFICFLIIWSFNVFSAEWGYSVPFLIFGACSFFALCFILLFVPETRGKSLDEIEKSLNENAYFLLQ